MDHYMLTTQVPIFIVIGLTAGIASGVFGIGGGVLIIPALMYLAGFSQHLATGTSLAVLLPPIGLAAVLEYYHHGAVDFRAALIIAVTMFIGGGLGALAANRVSAPALRLAFGIFVTLLGASLVLDALRHIGRS
jgi:uncharacterized membrane protein YfcA